MRTCPAPWCNRQLSEREAHPDHDAMMADPDWEYYVEAEIILDEDDKPRKTGVMNIYRRPKKHGDRR